jgi:NAD(P)-dependent dehydrogenase (short-subunit alcohol dehydrogenase family)
MRNPAASPELGERASKEKLPIRIETMDVDSDDSVKQAFGRILAQGPVDVLVNNAGVERTGAVEETSLADFRTCMETNYFGSIRCIQAVVRQMRERGSGAIINVTSVAGKIALSPMGPYTASKHALEALSEGLACGWRLWSLALSIRVWPAISKAWANRMCIRKFGGAPPCSRGPWRPEQANQRWWPRRFGRLSNLVPGSCGIR